MPSCRAVAAVLSSLLCGAGASAGPVVQVNPGLWDTDNEIWINGQSLKAGLQALQAKVRSGMSEAEKAELDREQGADGQVCLTPERSRIDLATYLESSLGDSGPWQCEVTASQLDRSSAAGRYLCRTSGGGLSQGRFTATYGPTRFRFELNGRGNAVDGRTGQALSGDMEQRLLSTGRWVKSAC